MAGRAESEAGAGAPTPGVNPDCCQQCRTPPPVHQRLHTILSAPTARQSWKRSDRLGPQTCSLGLPDRHAATAIWEADSSLGCCAPPPFWIRQDWVENCTPRTPPEDACAPGLGPHSDNRYALLSCPQTPPPAPYQNADAGEPPQLSNGYGAPTSYLHSAHLHFYIFLFPVEHNFSVTCSISCERKLRRCDLEATLGGRPSTNSSGFSDLITLSL